MVPSIFVESIQGSEPQDMSLRDIDNNLWRLKIEKFYDGWNFTDGWVKFVKDNMIKPGDVLYYESSSPGILDFRVLSPSGREDDGVEHLEIKTTKRHAMKAKVKVEAKEANDIEPRKRRGKEKMVDGGDGIERRTKKWRNGKTKVKVEEVGAADNIDERPLKRRGKEKVVDYGNVIERLEMRTTKRRDERVEVKTEAADDNVDERPQRKREMEKVVDVFLLAGAADDHVDERPLGERDEEKVVDVGAAADDVDERPLGKQDEKVVDAGASASVRGKRRKKQDFSGSEVFKSGRVPMPKNPYFVVEMRDTRVNEMFMPVEVVKAYQLDLPLIMKVVDSEGREYHTTRKSWKDGRVNYCGGWKFLRRAIGAETGDNLICEFIRGGGGEGEGGDLHIRVTLARAE